MVMRISGGRIWQLGVLPRPGARVVDRPLAPQGGKTPSCQIRPLFPARRDEAAQAVGGQAHARLVAALAIPELARHLLVHLIEALAIVRVAAAADLGAASLP